MCLEVGRECRQGPEWGPVTTGRHSPEQPLSPPQGQRWPQWAPQPFAPAAAEAPCHQRQRFCPGPRHRPPAVGSGMGLGAVGAKALPPARPLPPMQSARPVPWLGPRPLPSPCQETPASTALHLCLCHHPPSPPSPPQPLPAPRLCAGPVAGTSWPGALPSYSHAIAVTNGRPQPRKHALAPLGSSWGEGLAPLSAVFLLTRMGEMNPHTHTTENTQSRQLFICF